MASLLWGLGLVAAVLWPSRIVGPLDGAPLDTPLELTAIGILLPALWWFHAPFLATARARVLIAGLLAWKLAIAWSLAQGGWCADVAVRNPPATGGWTLTRSWDARTYAESTPAACSAVMAAPYSRPMRLPAWAINLPYGTDRWLHVVSHPAHRSGDPLELAEEPPRPPNGEYRLLVSGSFDTRQPGALTLMIGDDVSLRALIDGQNVSATGGSAPGIALPAGAHRIDARLDLRGRDWRFVPQWNGRDVFAATVTSIRALGRVEAIVHRVGRWVPPAAIALLLALWIHAAMAARRPGVPVVAALAALSGVMAAAASREGTTPYARLAVVALALVLVLPVPSRLRNARGAWLLIGAPWLALIAALALRRVGLFTLFEFGDDPLTYQRFAYRIFFEGYWLEGGQRTFWNQPLYRWICGTLHLVFGDSSAGELVWDGFGLLAGAMFAFVVVDRAAGFRGGIAAAVAVLITFALGPNWYLIGRGLSEISALMWLYLASCCVIAAAAGRPRLAVLGGVFGVLGYYTRMNHLPIVLALGALSLLEVVEAGAAANVRHIWRQLPKRVVLYYYGAVAVGLFAFAARTWYYTGRFSLFAGTSLGFNALGLGTTLDSWTSIEAWRRTAASVLMLVTVQDPPRFDVRSVLVVAGVALSLLGLARLPRARRLPLGLVLVCLAAISGGLVVRGSAYPGRFSVHLIPIAVTVTMVMMTTALKDAT